MIIGARFHGPPESGNGGYTAGRMAQELAAVAGPTGGTVVTLRAPVPLEKPLRLEWTKDRLTAYDEEDTVVAEATAEALQVEPVAPVEYADALAATERYPGLEDHPFPSCFVCGPRREPGDGLRIFPGPVGDGRVAAAWEAPDGVDEVTVWAALDCPGGWSVIAPGRPYVLGRMAARVDAVPTVGARCVIVGALDETEGRKARVRTTLYGPDQAVLAVSAAIWIAV